MYQSWTQKLPIKQQQNKDKKDKKQQACRPIDLTDKADKVPGNKTDITLTLEDDIITQNNKKIKKIRFFPRKAYLPVCVRKIIGVSV